MKGERVQDEPQHPVSEAHSEQEEEADRSPAARRFSLGRLGKRLAAVGEGIARTAAAAGEIMLDKDLRTRSAALLAEGAVGVARGGWDGRVLAAPCLRFPWDLDRREHLYGAACTASLARYVWPVQPALHSLAPPRLRTGLQQGAGRIAAGPRTVAGVLQKLQQRIEEQRIAALLEEQRDTPVDVQVGGLPA